MDVQPLTPEQCLDRIIAQVRKRVTVLRDTKIDGYQMVIHELEVVLDLLLRARGYIVNVSSKRANGL
jgi:hypothetical protein